MFWKKRIGSILKQLFLFKFKKLFSCMAFQHLQNREKGTENSHKYCWRKTYTSVNLPGLHPFHVVLPFHFCTYYSSVSMRRLNRNKILWKRAKNNFLKVVFRNSTEDMIVSFGLFSIRFAFMLVIHFMFALRPFPNSLSNMWLLRFYSLHSFNAIFFP